MGIAIDNFDLSPGHVLDDPEGMPSNSPMQEDLPVTTSIFSIPNSELLYNHASMNQNSYGFTGYNDQSWNSSQCAGPYSSPTSDGSGWKSKQPETWSTEDVTLFICSLMQSPTGAITPISINLYLNLRGTDLCSMSHSQMTTLDPENGARVYAALQEQRIVNAPAVTSSSYMGQTQNPSYARICLPDKDFKDNNNFYSIDVDDKFTSILSLTENQESIRHQRQAPIFMNQGPGHSYFPQSRLAEPMYPHPHTVPISPPISPSSSSSDGSQSPREYNNMFNYHMHPYGYDDMSGSQGNHLWEFIRDLLLDSRYNPSIIKWEDRDDGTFKFVKSDQVAKLWGRKKNNHAMTYEKLSRAMRYYYKRKILERIDGRRLVYKFGPAATGWKP